MSTQMLQFTLDAHITSYTALSSFGVDPKNDVPGANDNLDGSKAHLSWYCDSEHRTEGVHGTGPHSAPVMSNFSSK